MLGGHPRAGGLCVRVCVCVYVRVCAHVCVEVEGLPSSLCAPKGSLGGGLGVCTEGPITCCKPVWASLTLSTLPGLGAHRPKG